jgi:hypothetical protein
MPREITSWEEDGLTKRGPKETPWSRARKTRSQQQEERLGTMEGGTKQVNSGRFWRWNRDATLHNFLIEARHTDAGSYRVERAEFLDIRKQALTTPPGLLPAMQIDLGDLHLMVTELSAFQDREMRILELEELLAREREAR